MSLRLLQVASKTARGSSNDLEQQEEQPLKTECPLELDACKALQAVQYAT